MHDDPDGERDAADPERTAEPSWVGASGVSGEHVIGDERAPRSHRFLMIFGPLGLALAIVASLWSMSQHVERSVNVQVETRWLAGERLAIRTQIVGRELGPLADAAGVALALHDASGEIHELGELAVVADGLAQGVISVPSLEPGAAELVLRYTLAPGSRIEPFEERVAVEIVGDRGAGTGRQVVSENMLQWADDTDEQPQGVRIDLRPAGRLLAGFDNQLFVRVTDPAGKPWAPAPGPAKVQVLLVSGEFDDRVGDLDAPPVIYEGPVDRLGLASFGGLLSSEVVRFEVRLAEAPAQPTSEAPPATEPPPAAEAPPAADAPRFTGPKRRLRFVSHAGTVRIGASTDFAHPGDVVEVSVEAISARKPAFIDVHGPGGTWIDTVTPPLTVPQTWKWTVTESLTERPEGAPPLLQFEAYQSTLRPEDSSAIARVQIAEAGAVRGSSLAPLIAQQRAQLSLPRVDREFEIGRERAYLKHVEGALRELDEAEVARARAFLIGSLEAVVHGPPQSLNTRAREDADLASFKRKWTLAIRWYLLGGGGLFIALMSTLVWRNQRKLELQTSDALGLVEGPGLGAELDDEALADQSLAILQARRQILARGVLTVVIMAAALLLTVAMLESLVWEY